MLAAPYLAFPAARAQSPASTPTPVAPDPAQPDFPDSTSGLERLAKEILKAQKGGDSARASALAQSMILPDAAKWYLQTFGPEIARDEGSSYIAEQKDLPATILNFFVQAHQNHYTDVNAARFAETCDDNAGETAFGTLQLRRDPGAALYELRLRNGNQFVRLFAIAYVDGGFRYAFPPKIANHFPEMASKGSSQNGAQPGAPGSPALQADRVTAARLISKVNPVYPHVAREEHLQGTVHLHVIIDKDGAVRDLIVLQGYCSLAKSAMDAVSQWRYMPTLVNGQPVEVDTTIDVFFSLH